MTVTTLLQTLRNWIFSLFRRFYPQLGPTEEPMGEWYDSHKVDIDPLSLWVPSSPRFAEKEKGSTFGAEGVTAQGRPASTGADAYALQVTKNAAPSMPEKERQYVLTVARGEGFYGRGWKPGEGAGSHNWGAVQGAGPAGSFVHLDHHADGTPYHTNFKAYNSDEEGFSDMARILLKPNVKKALAKGSLRDAVFAQHDNGYFELNPEKYLSAVMQNYNRLTTGLGKDFPKLLSEKGGLALGGIVASILAGAGGFWLGRKLRGV